MAGTAEPLYLYLTTRGRSSGLPREIEIWFTHQQGRYYVIAEHGEGTQWVRNLQADPQVRIRVGAESLAGLARVVDVAAEPTLVAAVQERFREKYGWGEGLVVEIVRGESG
jgi:deazaflavin-dependent oxidoreductase (nitroreductase family)